MAKKKQGRNLVLLLVLLIILAAVYVMYGFIEKKKDEKKQASDDAETISMVSMEEQDLASIHMINELGELTLVKNTDGTWSEKDNSQIPLNQTYTKKMAESIQTMNAQKEVVEEAKDLSEYGLDNPSLTVEAVKSDGTAEKVEVGDKSALGDGYYACKAGKTKIYLIESDFYSTYHYGLNDLAECAEAPEITAQSIKNLLVKDQQYGTLEIAYETENSRDYTGSGLSPYVVKQGYKVPMVGDSDQITSYLGGFSGLNYQKCVNYEGQDLAKYGLDQPAVTIEIAYETEEEDGKDQKTKKTVAHTYDLLIGGLNESETAYYVKEADSNSIYEMERSMVEKLRQYKIFDLLDKYVQLVNVATINELSCTYEGETHTLSVEHKKVTGDDGKEKTTEEFKLDGNSFAEDQARKLYQVLINQRYQAEIPDGYTDTNKPVAAKFEFKRSEDSGQPNLTVEYREYDDSYDTVSVNGQEYFLIDKRDITLAVDAVKKAVGK